MPLISSVRLVLLRIKGMGATRPPLPPRTSSHAPKTQCQAGGRGPGAAQQAAA